jgi:hypothetical protein
MPVNNTSALAGPFIPNGFTTIFPFAFNAALPTDVKVYDGSDNLLSSALYTVALYDGDGGTVTFGTAPTAAAYPELFIVLEPSYAQTADFTNAGPTYNPVQLTAALDALASRIIGLKGLVDRSVKVGLGETPVDVADITALVSIALALTGPLYASTALGLGLTPPGSEFTVDDGDGTGSIYLNNAGVAVKTRDVILNPLASIAAAFIGTTEGLLQNVLDDFEARIAALEA